MNTSKSVYQRIMAANRKDVGLRLSADDVASLAEDEMVRARADVDDHNDERKKQRDGRRAG